VHLVWHSIGTVYIYKKYVEYSRISISSSTEVYWGAVGHNCSSDFLPDAKHLREVKELLSLIFSVRLHGHIGNCLVQARSRV